MGREKIAAPSADNGMPGGVTDIVVVGGGIAGLLCALALERHDRRIVVIERDASPDSNEPSEAFAHWRRLGVGQIRHTHAFRARFRQLLANEFPALLADLRAAGARSISYAENLPPNLRSPRRRNADTEMETIAMRRTLFETVLRRHVSDLPGVDLRFRAKAGGLMLEPRGGRTHAVGVLVDGKPLYADLIIDAGGRRSPVNGWLSQAGIVVPETVYPCYLTYHTRFFELMPGAAEPRPPQGRTGDLGYLKFGVIPADNATFSITLALPDVEGEIRRKISEDDGFMTACDALPGVAPFIDPSISRPISRVAGMADLNSRWRYYVSEGSAVVPGLVAIGDALIVANPLYGRGMTFALLQSLCLRDALAQQDGIDAITAAYDAAVVRELQPFYDDMRLQDIAAKQRADKLAGEPSSSYAPSKRTPASRLAAAIQTALLISPTLMRGFQRSVHMLDAPGKWRRGWRAAIIGMRQMFFGRVPQIAQGNPTRDEMRTVLRIS